MKENIERRQHGGKIQVRQLGNGHTIAGRITYNSRSEDLGFYEYMMPGCFTDSLNTKEVLCFFGHDANQVLGRQSNGTLRIADTPNALNWVCDLPDTQLGADTASLIRDKYVNANSFGFGVSEGGDEWRINAQGDIERRVYKATLIEVSPVSMPAYKANETVLVRSMPEWVREKLFISHISERKHIQARPDWPNPSQTLISKVDDEGNVVSSKVIAGRYTTTCANDHGSRQLEDITDGVQRCLSCHGLVVADSFFDDVNEQDVDTQRALFLNVMRRLSN